MSPTTSIPVFRISIFMAVVSQVPAWKDAKTGCGCGEQSCETVVGESEAVTAGRKVPLRHGLPRLHRGHRSIRIIPLQHRLDNQRLVGLFTAGYSEIRVGVNNMSSGTPGAHIRPKTRQCAATV